MKKRLVTSLEKKSGPVKPLEYLELAKQIQTMSEEEKENLQYMLNQLLNKAKDKK